MQCLIMVDTRAVIILLMKKGAGIHSLTIKEKVAEYILGANSTAI